MNINLSNGNLRKGDGTEAIVTRARVNLTCNALRDGLSHVTELAASPPFLKFFGIGDLRL